MAGTKTLAATTRKGTGKGAARSVRREGRIPGVIYGGGDAAEPIALDYRDEKNYYALDCGPESLALRSVINGNPHRLAASTVSWPLRSTANAAPRSTKAVSASDVIRGSLRPSWTGRRQQIASPTSDWTIPRMTFRAKVRRLNACVQPQASPAPTP